jgi:integrase
LKAKVRKAKRKYYPVPQGDYITKEQYDEILQKERIPYYHLLFEVAWSLMLRVSEVLSIRPIDIDAVSARSQGLDCAHTLRLWRKGDRLHILPLDKELRDRIVAYYAPRRIGKEDRIFPIGRRAVLARLNKYGYTVGGRKKVHPHALRRGSAIEEIRQQTPLPIVQAVLNHSDLKTTLRYIGQIRTPALNDWVKLKQARGER